MLLPLWFRLVSAAEPTAAAVGQMGATYARDVGILPPARIASIIAEAGFESPLPFFQAGLIHGWLSRRAEPSRDAAIGETETAGAGIDAAALADGKTAGAGMEAATVARTGMDENEMDENGMDESGMDENERRMDEATRTDEAILNEAAPANSGLDSTRADIRVENTDALGSVNRKIVAAGETLPAVRLQDGTSVQTGTVATMLHNIGLYNAGERGEVERELTLAIPTLFKVGLFDLFAPEDWINGSNPGRRFVGERALAWQAARDRQ